MNEKISLNLLDLVDKLIFKISKTTDLTILDNIRIKYLGKKGYFPLKIIDLRKISSKDRLVLIADINLAKKRLYQALNTRKVELKNLALNKRLKKEIIDISLPGRHITSGCLHPITHTINRIEHFFHKLGFDITDGPEIEDSFYNFDALNIPIYHPSRTYHDTFWFDKNRLLRTHTSSVQIRVMKDRRPPISIITTGRVYRKDYDQKHTPMFHQTEGLLVGRNIGFTNLKNILQDFLRNFFEKKRLRIRFRSSYFPFTEPSAEVDVMIKDNKWLELLGCGMVHPNVLRNVRIDPEVYCGFAFGMGVERLAMVQYDLKDLRVFFENDLRFLEQFK